MFQKELPPAPKNYFKLHFTMLKLMGIGVEDQSDPYKRTLYRIYSVFFFVSCLLLYTAAQMTHLIQNWNDLETATFTLCYLITQVTGLCKALVILIQRKKIRNYCRSLESDYFLPNSDRGGLTEFKIIQRAVYISNAQAYIFHTFVITIVTNRGFYAALDKGFYEDHFDEVENTTITKHYSVLPYNLWFPFDFNGSPYYEIAFVYQMVACTVYGLLIGTCDALITAFMVHLKAQIIILKNSLGNYVTRARKAQEGNTGKKVNQNRKIKRSYAKTESVEKVCPEVQKYVTAYVGDCIKHHQQILRLADQTESEFSLVMLLQFLASLMLMCFQLFQLSLYDLRSTQFLSMVIYLCLMLFQLFIYCWNGNEVQLESLDVAKAAYESNWIYTDVSTQKALMLMIRRAQRPIKLSAGKFAYLSLETFTAILRGSGSYYMVLRKVNE